jgi:hypothetical protein
MKQLDKITLADVQAVLKAKGYKEFTADGVPNIVGIRSNDKDGEDYDDKCWVWWYFKGEIDESHYYTITTNPGTYYLRNPIAGTKGTAILVPGQYLGCWALGSHKGQPAFIQTEGKVKVYRDADKDGELDTDQKTIEEGYFGINLHHGSLADANVIGKWSAGCQVWRFADAHQKLIQKIEGLAMRNKIKRFSYTLLNQTDFA